jgi:hypothetical protein
MPKGYVYEHPVIKELSTNASADCDGFVVKLVGVEELLNSLHAADDSKFPRVPSLQVEVVSHFYGSRGGVMIPFLLFTDETITAESFNQLANGLITDTSHAYDKAIGSWVTNEFVYQKLDDKLSRPSFYSNTVVHVAHSRKTFPVPKKVLEKGALFNVDEMLSEPNVQTHVCVLYLATGAASGDILRLSAVVRFKIEQIQYDPMGII